MYFADESTTATTEEPTTEKPATETTAPRDSRPDSLSCEERCRKEAEASTGTRTREFVRSRPRIRRRRVYLRRVPVAARQLGGYGFGERTRVTSPLTSGPPYLPYLTLDNFVHGSWSLTAPILDKIRFLAGAVDASWNSPKPIVEIRLVGHTDNTGPDNFNVSLGTMRAQSVAKELAKYPGVTNRVAVVVGKSPGKTQPTGDNRAPSGRALNRRVEVFVIFGVKPSPPPPPPPPPQPPCIDPRKCVTKLPEESVIITKPDPYSGKIPPGPIGTSLEQRLKDLLSDLPKPIAWAIRKAVITGTCAALEYWFVQAGGRLSETGKDQLRKDCEAQAKKPR